MNIHNYIKILKILPFFRQQHPVFNYLPKKISFYFYFYTKGSRLPSESPTYIEGDLVIAPLGFPL